MNSSHRIPLRPLAVLFAALLACGLLSACEGKVEKNHTTSINTFCPDSTYHDVYRVLDTRFRKSPSKDQKTRFSSYRRTTKLPGWFNTTCYDYYPALTVYVNCCGKDGTTTISRVQCTGSYDCYTSHETDWYLQTKSHDVWCGFNGSVYAYLHQGTDGKRSYVCHKTRSYVDA